MVGEPLPDAVGQPFRLLGEAGRALHGRFDRVIDPLGDLGEEHPGLLGPGRECEVVEALTEVAVLSQEATQLGDERLAPGSGANSSNDGAGRERIACHERGGGRGQLGQASEPRVDRRRARRSCPR